MPFTNDIAGGQGSLVRNWLQSANFVTGVSGWQIRKDGNVEFNNGTFRGSITSGTNPGQHVVINDGVTGDAVQVYDSGNLLVYNIDKFGLATSYYRGGGVNQNTRVEVGAGQVIFDRVVPGAHPSNILYEPDTAGGGVSADLHMQVVSYGVGAALVMDFLSGAFNGSNGPTVISNERTISGSLVQSDQVRTNNLYHAGQYSLNTNGSGEFTTNHNCSFTPTGCIITQAAPGAGSSSVTFIVYTISWTATTFKGQIWLNGALLLNNGALAYIIFFG